MSAAGGSTGGTYVWIKLATAKEDAFAKIFFSPGQDVADVAALACKELSHWRLDAGQVRLFMLATPGPKPPLPAPEAFLHLVPLAEEAPLESAGVTSGAWLVAVHTRVSGGGSAGSGSSSNSSAPAYLPLEFTTQDVGGASLCVAMVPLSECQAAPLFLAPEHYADLLAFIAEPPSATPQLLLVTGTVKSGKTQLVMGVLPRLLAAAAQARAAAVFTCTFRQGEAAEGAAALLVDSLCAFAAEEGVALAYPPQGGGGLNRLTSTVAALARALWARGRLLWVLLDELGAPLVASTPAAASLFVDTLKLTLGACCSCARFVATGSGMLTLLEGLRAASVHGFVLSAALVPISLGREPPAPVAAAMAQRIVEAYAQRWAARGDAAEHLTPARLLDALARGAHCGTTSPRPALLAFLADSLGSVRKGSPAAALEAALRCVLGKLREECEADAAVALGRLPLRARQLLRALADEGSHLPLPALQQHFKGVAFLGAMVETLCEGDSPARLMPPYGALLRSWVSPSGVLAVHCAGWGAVVQLAPATRKALVLLAEKGQLIDGGMRAAISRVVLAVLAAHGVGHRPPGGGSGGAPVRQPKTLDEFSGVDAVGCLLAALDAGATGGTSPATTALRNARQDPRPEVQQAFLDAAGFHLLIWLRHYDDAHAWFPLSDLPRYGLDGTVVEQVVSAVAACLVTEFSATFYLKELEGLSLLTLREVWGTAAGGGGAAPI